MSDSSFDLTKFQNRIAVSSAPRAAAYPADWVLENQMGPNALWLVEELTAAMDLRPGMRVLDLGCGRALTSVFLAREYGVHVTAADLWIDPSDNWERIRAAGVEHHRSGGRPRGEDEHPASALLHRPGRHLSG